MNTNAAHQLTQDDLRRIARTVSDRTGITVDADDVEQYISHNTHIWSCDLARELSLEQLGMVADALRSELGMSVAA